MHYYLVYGLLIESPIVFPEMTEIGKPAQVDATITFSEPPKWILEQYREGKFSSLQEKEMWFRLNDEIIIYVKNGREVCVHKLDESVSELRMRSYILTGALTFLLFQHDYIIVHGSALAVGEKVFIVSGPSGSGKSTTSLELLKKEEVLFASDDICAIKIVEGKPVLFPGPPWQKVCADVQSRDSEKEYVFLDEFGEKYAHKLTEGYVTEPLPVGGMFIISKEKCGELSHKEITGVDKLHSFTHNLFRGELINIMGLTPQKLQQFLMAIQQFPIYEIRRPSDKDTLAEIVELIASEIKILQSC